MNNLFTKRFMKVPKIPLTHMFREMGRNAFVDWVLILIFNFIVLIAVLAYGFYLYWQISSGKFVAVEQESAKEEKIFNKKDLDSVINMFESREDSSELIKRGYRGPSDPSL